MGCSGSSRDNGCFPSCRYGDRMESDACRDHSKLQAASGFGADENCLDRQARGHRAGAATAHGSRNYYGRHGRCTGSPDAAVERPSLQKDVRDASTHCVDDLTALGVQVSADPAIYLIAQHAEAQSTSVAERRLAHLYVEAGRRNRRRPAFRAASESHCAVRSAQQAAD